jgi:hypothetical protein
MSDDPHSRNWSSPGEIRTLIWRERPHADDGAYVGYHSFRVPEEWEKGLRNRYNSENIDVVQVSTHLQVGVQ